MNDFEHLEPLDLGDGLRVERSPGWSALNMHDDRYGLMIAMKREQALALRDYLNKHFPPRTGAEP